MFKKGRRAAVVCGVVGITAIAGSALAAAPDGSGPWADFVAFTDQGDRADGSDVLASRSDPTSALGAPDTAGNVNPEGLFYSLGFGGEIILGFENKICNGAEGDLDLDLRESTTEPYPAELVDVYVSPDGVNFTQVGNDINKDAVIAFPATITVAQHYVKLVDVTNLADYQAPNRERPDADGFDVDAVSGLNSTGCIERIGAGRMTGGGSLFLPDGTRVTHGFTLRCDQEEANSNNLQINWGKENKFHLETLNFADCTDEPGYDEGQPDAGFDTITGQGTGRYNGESGYTVTFKLTDKGEPGSSDTGHLTITGPDGTVLNVSGAITKGNQQAHHAG